MISLSRAGNYVRYMSSNWVVMTGGFILLLMTILVGMSFVRIGESAKAESFYGNYNNGQPSQQYGYPSSTTNYSTYPNSSYANYNTAPSNSYNNNTPANTTTTNSINSVNPASCREGMYYNATSRSCLTVTTDPPTCRQGTYYNYTSRSCVTIPQSNYNGNTYNNNNTYKPNQYHGNNYGKTYQPATYQTPYPSSGNYNNSYRTQPVKNKYPTYDNNSYGQNNNWKNKCERNCGNAQQTDYKKCERYCHYNGNYGKGNQTPYPKPSYTPQPTPSPTPYVEKSKEFNNSSSATATANVVINQAPAPLPSQPIATKAGYTGGGATQQSMPIELPKTGNEDHVAGMLGAGGLVAAGTAYAASRRELTNMIFKRN